MNQLNEIKILHLIDDEKFTDHVISQSLSFSNIREFRINHFFLLNNKKKQFSKCLDKNIYLFHSSNEYKNFIVKGFFDVIIVHCLTLNKAQVLKRFDFSSIVLVWVIWGVDFYKGHFYSNELFLTRTKLLTKQTEGLRYKIKYFLRPLYHLIKFGASQKSAINIFVNNINIIAPVLFDEFSIIKASVKSNAVYAEFPNGTLDSLKSNFKKIDSIMLGNNIFIGNSNAIECNHLDAFYTIKNADLEFDKVIVPLNYAGTEAYQKIILYKGDSIFGSRFQPLLDFMPYNEYSKKLLSCKIAIYNHLRQQAVGNIIISLYLGQKVFLSKKNIVYTFLKNNGFYVYCMESELTKEEVNIPLNRQQILKNRALLNDHYGDEAIEKKLTHFFETIIEISLHKKAMCKIRS